MTKEKLRQIEQDILTLNDEMVKLKEEYVKEYVKHNDGHFGRIIGEIRADHITDPTWMKEYKERW